MEFRRERSFSAILFWLLLTAFLVPLAEADVCQLRFTQIQGIHNADFRLNFGAPVILRIQGPKGNVKVKGTFIGRFTDRNQLFFADSRGNLVSIAAGKVQLQDASANPLSLALDRNINRQVTEISVVRQDLEDCAIQASVNCLLFMRQQGILESSLFRDATRKSLYDMFEPVDAVYLEQREQKARARNEAAGLGFWQQVFIGARAQSQTDLRRRLFGQVGIQTEPISSYEKSKLLKHLQKGFPAILDLPVKFGRQKVRDILYTGEEIEQSFRTTVPAAEEKIGGHSVVAIGVVKAGWFAKKIVILDSQSGEISLWDPKSLIGVYGGSITLVFPN